MTSEVREVPYGSQIIRYALEFRARKTLAISVDPRGNVTVAAPHSAAASAVDDLVRRRAQWITAKRIELGRYSASAGRDKLFVSGATHRYLGRRYKLKLDRDLAWSVGMRSGALEVRGPAIGNAMRVKENLDAWLRGRAHVVFQQRVDSVLAMFERPERVEPASLQIRVMSRRWGSMSPKGRLILNLALIEHPTVCIDYVIAHELMHCLIPNHSPKFWRSLASILPDWNARKLRLEGGGNAVNER